MKAELGASGDELTITLDADELGLAASGRALAMKLPGNAGGIADGIMGMIGQPPVPGDPAKIRVVHVRLVRTAVVAETTLALDGEREVWARCPAR